MPEPTHHRCYFRFLERTVSNMGRMSRGSQYEKTETVGVLIYVALFVIGSVWLTIRFFTN